MYESHFLLSHRPFTPAPSPDAYIPTNSLEQARQTLIRCLDRAEGPGLVIGPAGTGKSLLMQVLAGHFRGRFQVSQLAGARLGTRRALLQNILFELKLPYRDMDEGELRLSLVDHLEPRSGGTDGLLLLVDEAHTLPLRLLEEVRLLTNVVRDGQARVRLVLAGGMALEERLTSPKLASLHQRIAARCYLQPLGRDESIYYVQEQIRRCGARVESLFAADAQTAVYTATDGIPRLINQVCDHALMLTALASERQIDAARIEEAWADLQQLPVPLHEPPVLAGSATSAAAGIVEYGQLGEEPKNKAGSIAPANGDSAVDKLDAISRTIDTLRRESSPAGTIRGNAADDLSPAQFSPGQASGTEVDLYFHASHDPFGGQWEEEEVVIDRYATLEDAALRGRRVTSKEGRAMGAAVSAAAGQTASGDSMSQELDECLDPESPISIARVADFHPASDPLMPEEATATERPRRGPISLHSLAQDDREMIVVDDLEPSRSTSLAGRPRRSEYRQLFSSLRSK
jgi:type II secretory pathway predicted ATPase ExeA